MIEAALRVAVVGGLDLDDVGAPVDEHRAPDGTNIQLATSMTRIPSRGPAIRRASPTVLVSSVLLEALDAVLAADADCL